MASLSVSFVLFSLILSVLAAPVPVPDPQTTVASGPVTLGEVTTPSQGGTFVDFKDTDTDVPTTPQSLALASRVFKSDAFLPVDSTHFKRGFAAGFFPHGGSCDEGKGNDCFEVEVPPNEVNSAAPASAAPAKPASAAPAKPAKVAPAKVAPAKAAPAKAAPAKAAPAKAAPAKAAPAKAGANPANGGNTKTNDKAGNSRALSGQEEPSGIH